MPPKRRSVIDAIHSLQDRCLIFLIPNVIKALGERGENVLVNEAKDDQLVILAPDFT